MDKDKIFESFAIRDYVEICKGMRYWEFVTYSQELLCKLDGLKSRIKKEGLEPTTICSTLKLRATDGKMRLTDVAETEQLIRIIQSVPSLKPIVCTFIYENPKNIYPRYNGMSCVIYNFIYHYQYV